MYIKTDLTDEQKTVLQKLFQRPCIEPHVIAQQLHLSRLEAIALLDKLVKDYPQKFIRKQLVYHSCSDAPVKAIDDREVIKEGWVCPECGEEVDIKELNLDLMYKAIAPVDFLNPNDGLVRYWKVDYFPYYVKGFSPNTEPVFTLLQGDAEMFDEVLARQANSRQEAFTLIEREFERTVREIVRDLPR